MHRPVIVLLLLLALLPARAGAQQPLFTEAENQVIRSLSLAALPPVPPDPSNPVIDNPDALALGATLFFDMRLSANGQVACSTCHRIGQQFQDGLPVGKGVGTMTRRTQPLQGVAWQSSFFWDGRKDSLWSQALAPLEAAAEHGGNRAAYAHFMARNFRERYERVFGPMPDLAKIPANAGPLGGETDKAAWAKMDATDRRAVNTIFANMGKMLAAFQRSLTVPGTRFDRFAAGQDKADLSPEEIDGLRLFIGKAGCVRCHNGPRFTDGAFHNTGVPTAPDLPPDTGRQTGVGQLAADEFNCHGAFAAPNDAACPANSRTIVVQGAFKTPSLRGVTGRPPYMHAGQYKSLDQVLDHYVRAPTPPLGRSEIQPLRLTAEERAALIAFLGTLEALPR